MPSDAAVGPEGDLYVLDGVHHRVVVYDVEGRFRFQFGTQGSGPGQFLYPLGIAVAPDGNVYVADSGNHRFQVFAPDGSRWRRFPCRPPASDRLPIRRMWRSIRLVSDCTLPTMTTIMFLSTASRSQRFEAVWGAPGQGQRQFRFPFLVDRLPGGLPSGGRTDQHARPGSQSRRKIRPLHRRLGSRCPGSSSVPRAWQSGTTASL